jgi:hypothetical protein
LVLTFKKYKAPFSGKGGKNASFGRNCFLVSPYVNRDYADLGQALAIASWIG